MRRIIAILGMLTLGAVGCKHVGGKCDCGPTPGEHTLYAPMQGYPAAPNASMQGYPTAPGAPMAAPGNSYEPLGSPKQMQMPR